MKTIDARQDNFIGCDELRTWLVGQGFRIGADYLRHQHNGCNWYGYRRSSIPARECECNEGKPVQIIVKPHSFAHDSAPGGAWESVEVELTGETRGVWFKVMSYSLNHDELQARLPEIEAMLVAAWNALEVKA